MPSLLAPPVVDDATCRQFLAALAAAGLLSACGEGSSPSAAPPATRQFTHAFGTSTIPVAPQRIVTTSDQNALRPLLELGMQPVGSAGLVDEDSGDRTFRRTEGFDTRGVEHVGSYGEPNAEAIAALASDLIVGYEFDDDYAEILDRIAPFVGVQVFGRRLAEALLDFGDLAGRADRAKELQDAYDARVAAMRAAIAERRPNLTVSLLTTFEPGTFGLADVGQAIGTVAHDLDLGRPAAQRGVDRLAASTDDYSLELIGQHDADAVLVVDYSGEGDDSGTRGLVAQPLWQRLEAARRGQLAVIDGTVTVGAAWARMGAYLDVLETNLLGGDLVVTGVNA